MKKILFALATIVVLTGAASCTKGSATLKKDATLADSVAYYMGYVQGLEMQKRLAQMPEDMKAKFTDESFLKGLKLVLDADTADEAYLIGISYGLNMAGTFKQISQADVDVNRDDFFATFASAFKAKETPDSCLEIANQQFQVVMGKVTETMMAKQKEAQQAAMAELRAKGDENEAAGKAFIENLVANDNTIKTTESGLAYKVVKQGNGATPAETDHVKVIYKGSLIDGTEFDSSNGEATSFAVNRVVPGFKEALMMMNPGSKYTVYIPGNLAYGLQSPSEAIPPMATLIFDIELVEVEK